jgi:hypothetical protein
VSAHRFGGTSDFFAFQQLGQKKSTFTPVSVMCRDTRHPYFDHEVSRMLSSGGLVPQLVQQPGSLMAKRDHGSSGLHHARRAWK